MCMATKFIKITFILFAAFLIHSCSKDNNPIIPENKIVFGLYYLKDTTLKTYNISTENPDTLKLQDKPFISNLDIDYYDYSSHCIYLKKVITSYFPFQSDFDQEFKSFIDRPFVVVASEKICYVGYFESYIYGYIWKAPAIKTMDCNLFYPKDILRISWDNTFEEDLRDNEILKEALKNTNLFHGGLNVEITNLTIIPADTTTIEYSIKISNNDPNNLYVFDPEKAGKYFHYYNNGPVLLNKANSKIYGSDRKIVSKPDPLSSWKPEWFTKIAPDSNIKRTIRLKGFPDIPYGVYLINFRFNGPIYSMEKEQRMNTDGRYWIGYAYSGIIGVNYQKTTNCRISEK
jgi:hypothetical protein